MKKDVLIVGGSSGIGFDLIKKLAKQGNQVYNLSRTAPEFTSNHYPFDVTTDEFPTTLEVEQLDGLVYCPGTINLKPFRSLKLDDYKNDMDVNFFGAIKVIKACLPKLKKSAHASIVLFSTIAVAQGMPYHASIASAKGAVEGLTRSLAAEFAPKIRVNCIAPSLTDTPLASKILSSPERIEKSNERHPLKRIGQASDISSAVAFLLGEESSWMTGQVLHLDGGLSTLKI